ncbi:hypothetical protein P1P68_02480 [Streptomyces scabiei]|uniref:hypothetical protein n=1 Tax=Streptomyces scabiei TaxID=1930 RepID=UPI00298FD753|nr:hypothetical protein [Streptomyces scabiei]MDW8803702.1 hypothetical protein [Streptomyces scabiei]
MPAHPRIPNPQEGPLQEFAYDLRQLGEGKVSVPWIAEHEETAVSRAALYAALSGTRLPKSKTLSTLLRWWAGNPADEQHLDEDELDDFEYFRDHTWSWIDFLPSSHEGRRLGLEWQMRYLKLLRASDEEREFSRRAPRVTIDPPPEQQRLIKVLNDLIGKTGLQDELWLLFGASALRIERYLAGEAIPNEGSCWLIANKCAGFAPDVDYFDDGRRLEKAAEVARLARVRDRRIARRTGTSRG